MGLSVNLGAHEGDVGNLDNMMGVWRRRWQCRCWRVFAHEAHSARSLAVQAGSSKERKVLHGFLPCPWS